MSPLLSKVRIDLLALGSTSRAQIALASIAGITLGVLGCSRTADVAAPSASMAQETRAGLPAYAQGSPKSQFCHRTNGINDFILITIADAAVPAHRAHGDGAIGDPVPGQSGMVFDETCNAVAAGPAVVYTNFAPGMLYDSYRGLEIKRLGVGDWWAWAMEFEPAEDYRFESAQVAVASLSGSGNLRLFLQADASLYPGPVLEEIAIEAPVGTPDIVTAVSSTHPILRRGTRYWLSIFPRQDGVSARWQYNGVGNFGERANMAVTTFDVPEGPYNFNSGVRGVFQINGTRD